MSDDRHHLNDLTETEFLPPDLQALHEQLVAAGATWRTHLPPADPLAQRVIAGLDHAEHAGRFGQTGLIERMERTGQGEMDAHSRREKLQVEVEMKPQGRARGLLAVAAMLMIIGLMAALLHSVATSRSGEIPGGPTPTPTFSAYSGPAGRWVAVPGLTGNGFPLIAPSDPRVVYQVVYKTDTFGHTTGVVVRRTDDDGTTWHDLPAPGLDSSNEAGPINTVALFPSPINADVVFLVVAKPWTPACPVAINHQAFVGGARDASGMLLCSYQYYSADGGEHWQPQSLPSGGAFGVDTGLRPFTNELVVRAQGTRLYALEGSEETRTRLDVSEDGGATWHSIDGTLAAQHQPVVDFMPTPDGSTVFAVTLVDGMAPFALWRSDDVGKSWKFVSNLPSKHFDGMRVTGGGSGKEPLVYIFAPTDAYSVPSPADLLVSEDGGHTWKHAPVRGLLAPDVSTSRPLGVLSDGSVMVACPWTENFGNNTSRVIFYAWKDGDAAWRQLTPESAIVPATLMVTPTGPAGPEALWAIAENPTSVQRFVLP